MSTDQIGAGSRDLHDLGVAELAAKLADVKSPASKSPSIS